MCKVDIIEVKGFWNKDYKEFSEGNFISIAAVGVYNGTFNDDDIFYWFDDWDKIIGNQGDFTITSFEKTGETR